MSKNNSDTISLDAIDREGKQRKVALRVVAIGPKKSVRKNESSASNADANDPFFRASSGPYKLLEPPYSLAWLCAQKENNTELGQCINAMRVNIPGFGWTLRVRAMPEAMRKALAREIEKERHFLHYRLETVHPVDSLDRILSKVKDDQHSCGNGYIELIDDNKFNLVGLNHVIGHTVRLTERMPDPTLVNVPTVNSETLELSSVPMWYRFRRFATVTASSGKVLWFKEAGDARQMDKYTGEFGENIKASRRATSLLHFCNYNSVSAYGVPYWIGNLFSVRGSRRAEEINFNTLTNNAIPSMFIIVENGSLTEASIARLQKWTTEQIQKEVNYSRFLLMEGETNEDGAPTPQNFRIRIQPLANIQRDDQLFQQYDQNNREKIRQSFRLPPVLVGRSDDYTRATADTSRAVADEQVFAPERTNDSFMLNRFILLKLGARFHTLKLNTPNITDDAALINLMGIAERSGAMTPRRADRIVRDVFGEDIGPMPEGIPLDVPFSVSFAQSQMGLLDTNQNPDSQETNVDTQEVPNK